MELKDALQLVIQNSLKAAHLTDVVVGTVVSTFPLQVTINTGMAPLNEEVIYRTDNLTGLQAGDHVLLLMVQRGQKFVLLSKLKEA